MMRKNITIDGTEILYSIAYNVSRNYANPHRANAWCQCGMQFMELGASRNIDKYIERYVKQSYVRHKSSGFCKLHQAVETR